MIKKSYLANHKSTTIAVMILGAISSSLLMMPNQTAAQGAAISHEAGHDYIVKSGDGLYKLGRQFFGKGVDYKKIVRAHNAKAVNDSRYKKIDPNKGLEVGQLIWIPVKGSEVAPSADKLREMSGTPKKPAGQTAITTPSSDKLVKDYTLPKSKSRTNETTADASKADDPAYVVTLPKSNCEIRIWYNFQLVAIKKINERWKEQGIGLVERARRAYDIRHQARLNGRYMMDDKFEVAALRDRDNKKYGNPDGPTFEHMVAFGKENGLTGDRIYQGIIESSSRVQPVYKSSCVKR